MVMVVAIIGEFQKGGMRDAGTMQRCYVVETPILILMNSLSSLSLLPFSLLSSSSNSKQLARFFSVWSHSREIFELLEI